MNFLRRIPALSQLLSRRRDHSSHKKRRTGEFLRSMVIVVPLTILIWIYSENAQKTKDFINTTISVTVDDPMLTPTIRDDADSTITINITGPHGQIDLLKNELASTSIGRRIKVPLLADDAKAGDRMINLANTLANDPRFASSGVQITEVVPPQLHVSIDPVTTRKVALVLPKFLPVTLLNVSFDPPRVEVRGPRPLLNKLFGPDEQAATNEVDLSNWANLVNTAIGPQKVAVPVRILDPTLDYDTSHVNMSFEVGSTIADYTFDTVPISVLRPLGDEGRYRVEMKKPVVYNVHIRGPANLVDQYSGDRPKEKLFAILSILKTDIGGTDITRNVDFSAHDPQITILDGPYPVTFSVIETPNNPNH